jgi:hypothetical protein
MLAAALFFPRKGTMWRGPRTLPIHTPACVINTHNRP